MSQGTGEVACPDSRPGSQGGIWGKESRGHRFTSETPRAGLLNPPCLPPARGTHAWGSVCSHGLLWPTQGRGWPYPDPSPKG